MLSPEKQAQLTWRCRRGMLELDLIFERFLKHKLHLLSESQLQAFEALLNYPDPDLFAWLMGYEDPPEPECTEIVNLVRLHN